MVLVHAGILVAVHSEEEDGPEDPGVEDTSVDDALVLFSSESSSSGSSLLSLSGSGLLVGGFGRLVGSIDPIAAQSQPPGKMVRLSPSSSVVVSVVLRLV
jgi:hypothetical protein